MEFIISTYNLPTNSHKLSSTVGCTNPRTFMYDAMGNLSNDGQYDYAYGNRGRINAVTWVAGTTTNTVTYDINALGQRVRKTASSSVGGTRRFMYDEAGRLTGEYESAGNLVQETVWLGDLPVATLRPQSGSTTTPIAIDIFYVHADHLGTPRAITRPTDNKVVWSWENMEAFGNNLPNENPSALGTFTYNLRMPGQYFDQETGTHYNYYRDFDPNTGRYVQSDPIGLKGGINTYGYVKGNPLSQVDPNGLCACNGGKWDQNPGIRDWQFSAAFGGYFSMGRVNFTCSGNYLKCTAKQVCIGGGAFAGAGLSMNLVGTSYASDSSELAGWSGWQVIFGVGPASIQGSTEGGGSLGVGPSIGAGVGAIRCYTKELSCNCPCKAK